MSQDSEDTNIHEDELSLSISELPPEDHCGESLAVDLVHCDFKEELDIDSCIPRYPLTTYKKYIFISYTSFLTFLYARSVLLRKREMTCWRRALHRHRRPSSQPSLRHSSQRCAMMQRKLGGATLTSLCPTQMGPVQSTLFKCFLHCFRYNHTAVSGQSDSLT